MFIILTTGTYEDAKMRINIHHIVSYVRFSNQDYTQLVTSDINDGNYFGVSETPEQIDELIKQAMEK